MSASGPSLEEEMLSYWAILREHTQRWGGGPVGKVLGRQARGPGFEPHNPHQKEKDAGSVKA